VNKNVYVTRSIPEPGLSILLNECQVQLNRKRSAPSRAEILKYVADKDALLCMLTDRIDEEVINAAPRLKVISTYSTGDEHIDIEKATARGIYVTYTSDILAESTADLTFALILACARNIVDADRYVRENRWKIGWAPDLMLGYNVYGATLGIIGLGRIGISVARRARGFGMQVLYHNRKRNRQIESELDVSYAGLDELLDQSDFVSIHTSLNKDSYHLIDKSRLKRMRGNSFLINTSRGQIVNEKDLVEALKSNKIAGAALDVFENEPLPRTSALLRRKKNLILLPHIGSATYQTRSKMAEVAAKNLLGVLNGKEPDSSFLINPKVREVRPLRS
jgi:glyoxylate reductase